MWLAGSLVLKVDLQSVQCWRNELNTWHCNNMRRVERRRIAFNNTNKHLLLRKGNGYNTKIVIHLPHATTRTILCCTKIKCDNNARHFLTTTGKNTFTASSHTILSFFFANNHCSSKLISYARLTSNGF